MTRARSCPFRNGGALAAFAPAPDFADAYEIAATAPRQSIVETYGAVFGHLPIIAKALIHLRTPLVAPFGVRGVRLGDLSRPIDTAAAYSAGDLIGRWRIDRIGPDEIIAGLDDRHLDFRVHLQRERRDGGLRVVLSTAVAIHNAFGRFYLASILPFHRFGVPWLLTRAARAGRL